MPPSAANQSALFPAGAQAASIHQLWSLMLWTSVIVTTVVGAYIFLACWRGIRNRRDGVGPPTPDRVLTRGVAAAVGTTVIVLVGLLIASIWTGREVGALHASSA